MTIRTKEFVNVFFITFSLSTELLEDKEQVKLGGVDMYQMYRLFQILLVRFWTLIFMIRMKLNKDSHCLEQNNHDVIFVQK